MQFGAHLKFDEGDSAQAAALKKRRVTRWVIFFIVVSSLLTAGAFLYSLKDLAADIRSRAPGRQLAREELLVLMLDSYRAETKDLV